MRAPTPKADGELLADVARLESRVTEHKTEIRHRRDRLAQDAAALAQLRAECERRGIKFINRTGVEDSHGRHEQGSRS